MLGWLLDFIIMGVLDFIIMGVDLTVARTYTHLNANKGGGLIVLGAPRTVPLCYAVQHARRHPAHDSARFFDRDCDLASQRVTCPVSRVIGHI